MKDTHHPHVAFHSSLSAPVMEFTYRARDPLGRLLDGHIEAPSSEEATQQLRRDGFHVLHVVEAGEGGLFAGLRPISRKDIVYVTTQLAVMTDTGITLSAALEGIAMQEPNVRLQKVLRELKTAVEAGEDFSSALERFPRYFDSTYVALIRASEATGTMSEMLDRIATYLRRDLDNRSKVRAALAYPGIMLALAVAVTVFLLVYVMPQFTPLFSRRGVKLPKITTFMMGLSESMIQHWPWWTAGVVAAIVGVVLFRRTETGGLTFDWLKINVPLLGPLFRKVILSRSISTLGTMVASGISMLEALQLTAEVSANRYYKAIWDAVRDDVTGGRQINESLSNHPLIPTTLVQMVSAGEQTGKLDAVLERVSSFYDRDVEHTVKAVTSLLEPLMIVCMGGVVGGIAMSLLLPIFTLSRAAG